MFGSITSFLVKMAGRLARIASATRSGPNAQALHADVWIAASEIGEKRNNPVDLDDPADQELVISRVFSMGRRKNDWQLHFAVPLDAECEGNVSWAERIPDKCTADPLRVLIARETADENAAAIADSYTQAAAYVAMLRNVDDDRDFAAAYLAISLATFSSRFDKSIALITMQRALFDGINWIDDDFMPLPGRHLSVSLQLREQTPQWELAF